MPSACNQEGDEILDALKNAVLDSPFLFGFGGIATYLIEDAISKRGVVDTMKELGESLATAALSSALMAGAGRGVRTLHHVRNFKEDFHRSAELYRDTLKAYNLGNALTGGKLQRLEQELQLKAKKTDTPEQAQKPHPHK